MLITVPTFGVFMVPIVYYGTTTQYHKRYIYILFLQDKQYAYLNHNDLFTYPNPLFKQKHHFLYYKNKLRIKCHSNSKSLDVPRNTAPAIMNI
jgi:hypothetical protein